MTNTVKTSYRHGDLPAALLCSARTLLEKDGITALKLRAITRHAGVSATAATPHFSNLKGLLSALAAQGFTELADAMMPDHAPAPRDVAIAYVHFAITNPGLFTLMFRSDTTDRNDVSLQSASHRAFNRLSGMAETGQTGDHTATIIGLWGKVHGVAILMIEGLLNGITSLQTSEEQEAILKQVFR
ncbi:TetR/AcrR family transcriptional regulator [Acetobacter thailandicus]|uniref:TetR/AcrR family transcriptional regulator n=1 Tax=Acetobacter thailandicus TaxID=1502842 RepID=UPI001BA4EA9C|nr:TetR/AcrR family transcriptional regulator [Acetobacter thailandicus]MBS0961348.1 WHG domain-containing protein [Acetobacter thailandicus]